MHDFRTSLGSEFPSICKYLPSAEDYLDSRRFAAVPGVSLFFSGALRRAASTWDFLCRRGGITTMLYVLAVTVSFPSSMERLPPTN